MTTKTNLTLAEQLANEFNNDGQLWHRDGEHIIDVAQTSPYHADLEPGADYGREFDLAKFEDGSAIRFYSDCWDIDLDWQD